MRIKRSHVLFAAFGLAYLAIFLATGYTVDADKSTQAPFNGSVFIFLWSFISRFSLANVAPIFYGLFFAHAMTRHVIRREWERALFFASPFVWVNITDVFNRVMFCLACAY